MSQGKSMKIKLIETLGLKNVLMQNLVYRPPTKGR
jgi:hypothetical protein